VISRRGRARSPVGHVEVLPLPAAGVRAKPSGRGRGGDDR